MCDASPMPHGAGVGDNFPDSKLTDCGGVKATLDTFRCQHDITLVSIGAGWCMPCREETPDLEAAAAALADEGVGVVQVLFQDQSADAATTAFCDAWVQEFNLTIPVFIDPVGNTLEPFDNADIAAQMPLNVIIDRAGKVLFSDTGKIDDVEGTLRQYLP